MARVKKPKPPPWWVYILRCADGSLYTGVTTDPARRLRQHNAGTASKYTRSRRPVVMVFREDGHTRGSALRRELHIKSLTRRAKMALVAAQPASTTAPATTSPPPIATRHVSGSPRKRTAKTITSATLSLSSGATRDAGAS